MLGGLLRRGRCGRRMLVRYGGPKNRPWYGCTRGASDYGEPLCQSLSGPVLDDLVAQQILAAVEPAALEASLAAVAEVERERAELTRHWQLRLERAGTRPSGRAINSRPVSRRTDWWPGNWNGAGRKRCDSSDNWRNTEEYRIWFVESVEPVGGLEAPFEQTPDAGRGDVAEGTFSTAEAGNPGSVDVEAQGEELTVGKSTGQGKSNVPQAHNADPSLSELDLRQQMFVPVRHWSGGNAFPNEFERVRLSGSTAVAVSCSLRENRRDHQIFLASLGGLWIIQLLSPEDGSSFLWNFLRDSFKHSNPRRYSELQEPEKFWIVPLLERRHARRTVCQQCPDDAQRSDQ